MPSVKYSSYATEVYCVLTFHITLILTYSWQMVSSVYVVGAWSSYMLIADELHLAHWTTTMAYLHSYLCVVPAQS